MKKLNHMQFESYYKNGYKYKKNNIPLEEHIILKKKTTHIERSKRDFRTHLKRLTRKTGCFLKKDDMYYSIIKTYIYNTETLLKMKHTS